MRVLLLVGFSLLFSAPVFAQDLPFVVSVNGRYVSTLSPNDSLSYARGPGLAVRADFWPERLFGASLVFGYDRAELYHEGDADRLCRSASGPCDRSMERSNVVRGWGWDHWTRVYRPQVLDLDPFYAATFTPVEHTRSLSAAILPSVRFGPERIRIHLQAGPSVSFTRRTLYLDEQWAKTYAEIGYTYRYGYRNNAPDKTGFSAGIDASLSSRVRVVGPVDLTGAVHYRRFLGADSQVLPYGDLLGFELGISIR